MEEEQMQCLADGTPMISSTDEAWDNRILGADERYVSVVDDETVLASISAAVQDN
ncbi:hypothetical protein HMI48_09810 [Acidithiobacillus ferrooxidans]|uniref:hypothetical protein n=1 Tax=Acidithiobacillus ferrooxidans TaxID=920 RepID=UPI001C068EBB|nr:hypothetical protein [Acidithiobacillus ferrooxidans]MBU2774172.1 hypothetical protein [Acidithiobacillus ferrooxidans]